MSRKGKDEKASRFVAIQHWMMRTDAWRDLDCVARCAYIELASRYRGSGSNNGRIACSVRQITEALNIGKTTARRALANLQNHGFIVEMKKGSFNSKVRHATQWRLTEFGCDVTGILPTKDFARWEAKPPKASSETPSLRASPQAPIAKRVLQ